MCFQLYLVIAATVCIQSIFPDEIVQISQETDTRRYVCGNTAVFKCHSNDTDCCSTFGKTRFWKKDGVIIMNHGTEINPSNKYTETFDDDDDNFFLTVQHLTDEDFDKDYGCEYVSQPDSHMLKHIYTICWCYECGIKVYGFLSIGEVVNLVAALLGVYQEHRNKGDYKGIAAALFFSLSVTGLFNGLIAGTAGIYKCLCYDGKGPLMIIAGIGTGLVGTIPAVFIHKNYYIAKIVWLLGTLAVVIHAVSIALLIWIGGYLKGRCPNCGGLALMFSIIGSVIAMLVNFCFLYCCISSKFMVVKKIKRAAIFSVSIFTMSLVVDVVFAVPIGTYLCPCFDDKEPSLIALGILFSMLLFVVLWIDSLYDEDECTLNLCLSFAGFVVLSLLVIPIPFLIFYSGLSDDANSSLKKCLRVLGLVVLAILIFPIPFLIIHFCLEEFIEYIRTKIGSNVQLKSPFKNYSEQITWTWTEENSTSILILSLGTNLNLKELPQELAERLTLKDGDLFISIVQESDTGIYACELSPKNGAEAQVSKLQLTVRGGGNNRSKESGSSCWPPCSVGPDPNSPDPENARSLLKKKADKKNEKKPVAVVRSQPPKNRHVKTDNTESTRYSAETEIFDEGVHKSAKPRPLPSIGQPSNSPSRPLPQMPPSSQLEKGGIQLEPLGDSTSEKKKKKRRKKKESKQSDEED